MVGSSGDLLSIDGLDRGRQRIIRRLLTNPGDYTWHPDYGAGLGRLVGETRNRYAIESRIRSQIMQEACVARTPLPVITSSPIPDGLFVSIVYTDTEAGQQVTLQLNVRPAGAS